MAYRMWVKCNEASGAVEQTMLTDDDALEQPWLVVPDEMCMALRQDIGRYKIKDGCVEAKKKVRLSVSTPVFKADGKDSCFVMVVEEERTGKETVKISINGQVTEIEFGQVIEISTNEEGRYVIAMEDDDVFAERPKRETLAVKKVEEE